MLPFPNMAAFITVAAIAMLGFALVAATWPLRHASAVVRRSVLIPLWLVLAATPFFITWIEPAPRSLLAILIGAILPCKMLDAHLTADTWRTLPFVEWLKFLAHPTVLVRRLHLLEPPRTRAANIGTLVRGVATVIAGQVALGAVAATGIMSHSFWIEHLILAIAFYVIFLDGGNVMATGILRCLGSNVTDLSRTPILSATPAEFWRRYNRNAGQFFAEDVFKPMGGLRRPVLAIFGTFLANGLLHEYIMTAALGRPTGYMIAFFLAQPIGVALTFRIRPRSLPARLTGMAATFVFNCLTVIFFFASIHATFKLYRYHTLLP